MSVSSFFQKLSLCLVLLAVLSSCTNKEQVSKIIANNPEILTEAIKKNPVKMGEALAQAQREAQKEFAKRRRLAAEEERNKFFKKPLTPKLSKAQAYRGPASAKVTIVEYTDFECPYCSRGAVTMKAIREKYKDKVRITVKHLPLRFHPNAMIAAQYFEAIRLQSPKKAWDFHDLLFENQNKLRKGEPFLKAQAKKMGINMKRLSKDINSETVKTKIREDMAEASRFGIRGTPGFVVNGVPLKGALPFGEFAKVIDRHLAGR